MAHFVRREDNPAMSEDTALAVPTSVKERRKALKWSQERLGQEAGISTTAVHNLEAGKNGFTDKTLASLAKALSCRPADLLLPMSEVAPPIRTEPEILSFLARIEGLKKTDIDTAFGVILLALQANRGGSRSDEDRDPVERANRPRESVPSR